MGHLEGITFIDSKGDGRYFISNSKDQSIKLWDIRKMSSSATAAWYVNILAGLSWLSWNHICTGFSCMCLLVIRGHEMLSIFFCTICYLFRRLLFFTS